MHLDLKPAMTLASLASLDPTHLDDEIFARVMTQDASGVQLVVGASTPEDAELVTVPLVQQAIDRLRAVADYVVLDTPPTFSQHVLAALDVADAIAIIAEPHVTSIKAAKDWLSVLDKLSFPNERSLLVLNRTTPTGLENDNITKFFDRKPDIVVPYTQMFDEAADRGRPLVTLRPDNVAVKVLRDLAAQLTAPALAGR
jgi:pilus assembly protein CpaE